MTKNCVNSKIIGCIKNENNRLLGTCFLFAENYIFTARHVVEKYISTIEKVKCYFEEINYATGIVIEYENQEYDIAILRCIDNYTTNIKFYNFAISEAECEDKWQSEGYPAVNGKNREYLNGTVRRVLCNNPCTIYELIIDDEKESSDWEGVSGAPIIIDNEIAAIVIREIESNIKTRLKAISFFGIFQLLEKEKKEILGKIKSNYDPVLKERIDFFETSIKDIFYNFSVKENIIGNECFILKNNKDCLQRLIDIIGLSIGNYGTSIVLYKKAKQGNYKEKLIADSEIRENTKKVLELISTNEHLVYILLWALVEGAKRCPRIGSRIVDTSKEVSTDIYIDESDDLNIYFSCGKIDGDFLTCLETGVEEISKYINNDKLSLEDEIISWDELAVSSLNYTNRKKIENFREESQHISVGVFVISSFECYDLYKREDIYDLQHDYDSKNKLFKQFLIENNSKIEKIVAKHNWISKINVVHFILPLKDLAQFNIELRNYL